MYTNQTLTNHLKTSSSIKTKSKIIAEWNINNPETIKTIGNYKYNRPNQDLTRFNNYAEEDENTPEANRLWYGNTEYDTVVDGGYTDISSTPVTFLNSNERQKSLMSLEDCFGKFRPRSGINKLRLFYNQSFKKKIIPAFGNQSKTQFKSPRYYVANKNDLFKYWSSYKTQNNIEYGISDITEVSGAYPITDVAPFVVYKNEVPTNKIVLKIQTNVGDIDNGALINSANPSNADPFYINSQPNYKSVPKSWKIQKLIGNNWEDMTDLITTDVFSSDGYFQLSYGIKNSEIVGSQVGSYKESFVLLGTLPSSAALPLIQDPQRRGQAYLVKSSSQEKGKLYIYNGLTTDVILQNYDEITPQYGWYQSEESITNSQLFVTELNKLDAPKYTENGKDVYREFEYIRGLRVVVNSMVNKLTVFDLIELSPRLEVDITEIVKSFNIKKVASDLGVSNLPVGQLLASSGELSILDTREVFNSNNKQSILNIYESNNLKTTFINKNTQFKFYEIVSAVPQGNDEYKDFYVPIKTMYSDGFLKYSDKTRDVNVSLRDLTFYFESFLAPEIFLTNASTSFIVATLLDSIGFSNYKFYRLADEKDVSLPLFMVPPNKTVMQILQDLAIATQTTMFFDEQNNFIVMNKEYLVPGNEERATDIELYGYDDPNGLFKSNIMEISSESNDIYNDGKIVYYNKYIQTGTGNLNAYSYLDKTQELAYQRVELWSLQSDAKAFQNKNEEDISLTSYPLSAIPLSADLNDKPPYVENGEIKNNVIDFGDGVYWLARANGYFYANGEIIKFDAIEYTVSGENSVWITSNEEYQYYYGKVPIGQKFYKTGKVRIYTEVSYKDDNQTIDKIVKHGRAQFGTTITNHKVTVAPSLTTPLTPLVTQYKPIFKNATDTINTIKTTTNKNTITKAKMNTPALTIKNFLGPTSYSSKTRSIVPTEDIQASALSLSGPTFTTSGTLTREIQALSCINHVKVDLTTSTTKWDTFGARLRIVGEQLRHSSYQQLSSSYEAYTSLKIADGKGPDAINAGSGGIAIMTNSDGEGYYYEILALDYKNEAAIQTSQDKLINTIFFYKLKKDVNNNNVLVPEILHESFKNILVDTGKFTSKVLRFSEAQDSVYDIAVTVNRKSNTEWVFSIYFDNVLLDTFVDKSPVFPTGTEKLDNMSLFIRGNSKVMFEHLYAIKSESLETSSNIFNNTIEKNIFINKSSLSPAVRLGFLSKISPSQINDSAIYYEEFGTIMRECAYFNVKFEKAYPALRSSPPSVPPAYGGYLVSGYNSTPYRAEFLIFNTTDFVIDLGGNKDYLDTVNITGVTFTQQSVNDLTVDEFFQNRSSFQNTPNYDITNYKSMYTDIKNNRLLYGSKSFTIDSVYIQNLDMANNLMKYLINRVSKPRKAVAVKVFGMPIVQLGDLVKIKYQEDVSKNISIPNSVTNNNFVVYASEYSFSPNGPSTILYLSEVA